MTQELKKSRKKKETISTIIKPVNPTMVCRNKNPLWPSSGERKYGNNLEVTLLNPRVPSWAKIVARETSTWVRPIWSVVKIFGARIARLTKPRNAPI